MSNLQDVAAARKYFARMVGALQKTRAGGLAGGRRKKRRTTKRRAGDLVPAMRARAGDLVPAMRARAGKRGKKRRTTKKGKKGGVYSGGVASGGRDKNPKYLKRGTLTKNGVKRGFYAGSDGVPHSYQIGNSRSRAHARLLAISAVKRPNRHVKF